MKVSGKINKVRRRFTKGLTQGIGKNVDYAVYQGINPKQVKRILVSRPNNRLGNQLMITPLVQELSHTFPNAKIDLFVRGTLSEIIFENYDNIEVIYDLPKKPFKSLFQYLKTWFRLYSRKYDIVINAVSGSSSGKLSTSVARAKYKFFGENIPQLEQHFHDYKHMAKMAVYNIRYCLNNGIINQVKSDIPNLNIKLNTEEIHKGNSILKNLVQNDKKTIGIYTFATGNKCYSKDWWEEIYRKILSEFGGKYNIIEVLPIENCSQINFKAPSYYSKDIREMAGFLENLDMFLTADCGIMHLGCCTSAPLIGLFSSDRTHLYAPYGLNKTAVYTHNVSQEQIIEKIKDLIT